MAQCEFCGKDFDPDEAAEFFMEETWRLSYDNVRKCLCGSCAVKAVNDDKIDGVYFETCENCGREFDLIEEESRFANHFPWFNGTSLCDHWGDQILCADCAIEVVDSDD